MPYNNPEHKRQWERDHREERNARRRKSMSRHLPDPLGNSPPSSDRNSAQAPLTNTHVAIGGMMGLAFLLTVLIAFGKLCPPRRNYLTLGSPGF